MAKDVVSLFAKALLVAARKAREAKTTEWEAPQGSIVYRSATAEGIHLAERRRIRDDIAGTTLSQPYLKTADTAFADVPGEKTLWQLERDRGTTIYFVTRSVRSAGKSLGQSEPPVEIIHAHEDGFFPFRDALYTADLSFERVAAMLDLRMSEKRGPRSRVYFDSRDTYRERNRIMAEKYAKRRVRVANFDRDPLHKEDWNVFYPLLDGYSSDPETGISKAPDGSTLKWVQGDWIVGTNYNGMQYGLLAEWTAPDGELRKFVTVIPGRAWRDGHGETRCAQLIYSDKPKDADNASSPLVPDGETLAGLVNANVKIAGEHLGQMVVIDSRPEGHDWRVTTTGSWWA